jgi:hypothetical protein
MVDGTPADEDEGRFIVPNAGRGFTAKVLVVPS